MIDTDEHKWRKVDEDGNHAFYFPREVSDRVPKMLQYVASIWIVLAVLAVLFIQREKDFVASGRIY